MEVEGLVLVEGGLVGKEKGSVNWYSIFLILCFVVLFKEMSCSIVLDSKTTFQEKFQSLINYFLTPLVPQLVWTLIFRLNKLTLVAPQAVLHTGP